MDVPLADAARPGGCRSSPTSRCCGRGTAAPAASTSTRRSAATTCMKVTPGERWVLDTQCFWASDGEVKLSIHRERMLDLPTGPARGCSGTRLRSRGRDRSSSPVDGPCRGDRRSTTTGSWPDGPFVIARTAGISPSIRAAGARSPPELLALGSEAGAASYAGSGPSASCARPLLAVADAGRERAAGDYVE
jgi:hypothetical protein